MKLKKGDNIIITTGKDKGKKGKIVRVLTEENKVIVEGLNMMKKHQRPKKSGEKGTMKNIEMPLHASNVMMLDPKTGKATRLGKKKVGGKMVRIARKSNQEI
ncbi:MAG: 50S ribosomal protein L24 [Candidatus Nomurabacteria bacterium GW2011_GWC2_41_8]|uniref:Large ribosomal subunit protein uL24 n=3 Tax=Candidatus Nomuraibacteriota TaxID=1752729 RepID=A0A1F6Y9Z9_9BACT|nr:MAG: 50S ribosomal protein L24 [Candidatus Nomurabacteria bacterium GW2011_GWA2_41_25]KKS24355.1 MAG: 50S ribosomal protein L24 [Candidatus Nomurabacteria bacterium GW2011_GWC2_41_8]OGI67144.1 MAG: 50S ribosomal protein L24 [Candidatus Nomurabacteria bacterium RIFCSPHIGHO2_01_FULL_41_91]OGI80273.1 MAG: 50S ribosomal protein L24 [Candidatus Nomurabacteria bacterium RIFCSPHIGHO2_02_FULL_41_52]OGI84993.1 MAG: 50S ribosomal protein L24 [Candidatus Nomurabacteria bacterium RIFCSPHIGHO2_12_FULL_42